MVVTLNLSPEVERSLAALAVEHGMTLGEYLQDVVAREAGVPDETSEDVGKRFKNLSELLINSPFFGANLDLERCKDLPRPLDPLD